MQNAHRSSGSAAACDVALHEFPLVAGLRDPAGSTAVSRAVSQMCPATRQISGALCTNCMPCRGRLLKGMDACKARRSPCRQAEGAPRRAGGLARSSAGRGRSRQRCGRRRRRCGAGRGWTWRSGRTGDESPPGPPNSPPRTATASGPPAPARSRKSVNDRLAAKQKPRSCALAGHKPASRNPSALASDSPGDSSAVEGCHKRAMLIIDRPGHSQPASDNHGQSEDTSAVERCRRQAMLIVYLQG